MGRLIVISNRMGDPRKPAQGGLAVALNGALHALGGVWMGWSGEISDTAHGEGNLDVTVDGKITLAALDLNQDEYDGYYLGFSNSVLWPALHSRMDLIESDQHCLDIYRSVNRTFAIRLAALLQPDDVIWVHDYHLIPLAMELRAIGVENRIGFFLHIPLPPAQTIDAIPDGEWLMRSLFYYDVVGFQTGADTNNFIHYANERFEATSPEADCVEAFDHSVVVKPFPIGIDVEQFRALEHSPEARELVERLTQKVRGRKWVTGVERLDYSKGLPERLKIFRTLLQKYPENRGNATLVQVAPPTREAVEAYADIREELEKLSGAVNGEFATIDWTPVRYIHRNVPRTQLAGLFSISKVGLVTPLRDGMNLVAKEYIAVQPEDDPGVLVLSEFAGAAEQMTEALLVNPYNIEQTADILQRALAMSLEERIERYQALRKTVEDTDVVTWCQSFLDELQNV